MIKNEKLAYLHRFIASFQLPPTPHTQISKNAQIKALPKVQSELSRFNLSGVQGLVESRVALRVFPHLALQLLA